MRSHLQFKLESEKLSPAQEGARPGKTVKNPTRANLHEKYLIDMGLGVFKGPTMPLGQDVNTMLSWSWLDFFLRLRGRKKDSHFGKTTCTQTIRATVILSRADWTKCDGHPKKKQGWSKHRKTGNVLNFSLTCFFRDLEGLGLFSEDVDLDFLLPGRSKGGHNVRFSCPVHRPWRFGESTPHGATLFLTGAVFWRQAWGGLSCF